MPGHFPKLCTTTVNNNTFYFITLFNVFITLLIVFNEYGKKKKRLILYGTLVDIRGS